jgi:hypothetical protein
VPDERGRYVRTDKSVALVECPHCKAMVGEPCRRVHGDGYGAGTHADRRSFAARVRRRYPVDDVLHKIPSTPDEYMEANS